MLQLVIVILMVLLDLSPKGGGGVRGLWLQNFGFLNFNFRGGSRPRLGGAGRGCRRWFFRPGGRRLGWRAGGRPELRVLCEGGEGVSQPCGLKSRSVIKSQLLTYSTGQPATSIRNPRIRNRDSRGHQFLTLT